MKFRKKPVVIEAKQWIQMGDHANVEPLDTDDVKTVGCCPTCGCSRKAHGWVKTLEGGHIVCPGDWIITGVKGEHYPCKPDIFWATYEAVEGV
jgi:hypothetical protein